MGETHSPAEDNLGAVAGFLPVAAVDTLLEDLDLWVCSSLNYDTWETHYSLGYNLGAVADFLPDNY